ncbi:hypothetical protein Xbud_03286 [Xenorhabdus budapestensis]|uniref:Uncharacterized protein n=1 Tax=Xenorhabdus budapestensis TaxID=290110 RepID=A0A2D0IRN1_XENBU|nr:hypothetical protein Xbud_03286 [Xenorhabdus budapestensis]
MDCVGSFLSQAKKNCLLTYPDFFRTLTVCVQRRESGNEKALYIIILSGMDDRISELCQNGDLH